MGGPVTQAMKMHVVAIGDRPPLLECWCGRVTYTGGHGVAGVNDVAWDSKPGSELWILTVSGLQCIPLYALPIRHFSFNLDNLPLYSRAALQTLAAVAKQSLSNNNSGGNITFDFGNVMPIGFVERCCFDFVPEQLENCVNTIKHICESNVSQIAKMYNSGKCIPIKSSDHGYSRALKEVENDVTMAEIFEAKAKENCLPPIIGTTHID